MRPSITIYSMSSCQLIKYEIMEDELPKDDEDARHYFIEDESEEGNH